LGLNSLGLWPLTLALWACAYAALAVASVALWLFVVYGVKIIAISYFSGWIIDKLIHKKALWVDFLAFLIGSIIYTLLLSTPYVGWVFNILLSALGAGAAWMAFRNRRQTSRSISAVVPPPAVLLPSPVNSSIAPELVPSQYAAAPEAASPLPAIPPVPNSPLVSFAEPVFVALPQLADPVSAPVGSDEKTVNSENQPTLKMRRKKAGSPNLS